METKAKILKITVMGEGSQTGEQQQSENVNKRFCWFCLNVIAGEDGENGQLTGSTFSKLLRRLQICSSGELPESLSSDLGLCLECNKITGKALKQFQNLERIQMKLFHNLDEIRKKIVRGPNVSICNSNNGSVERLRRQVSAECINFLSKIRKLKVTIERVDIPSTLSKHNLSLGGCKGTTLIQTEQSCPETIIKMECSKTIVKMEPDCFSHSSFPSSPVQNDSDKDVEDNNNTTTSSTGVEFAENIGANFTIHSTRQERRPYKSLARAAEGDKNSKRMNRNLCSGIFGDIVGRLTEQTCLSEGGVERKQVSGDREQRKCGNKSTAVTEKDEKTNKCCFCNKAFPSLNLMRRHIKFVHQMEAKHKCERCRKSFYTEELLQTHRNLAHSNLIQRSGPPERYKCSTCDKSFYSIRGRQVHYKTKHLAIRYTCTFPGCSKSYAAQQNLTLHKQFKHPNWEL